MRTQTLIGVLTREEQERFFSWARWEGEELVWFGAMIFTRSGRRGSFHLGGRGGKTYLAPRIALTLYLRREIGQGMMALHTRDCMHELCIRFEHLYEGTPHENVQDAQAMGRMWYQKPQRKL